MPADICERGLKNISSAIRAENEKGPHCCEPLKLAAFAKAMAAEGGAEGNRTPVQTYSSKAFYMLIS
jgi:hypothetical protein